MLQTLFIYIFILIIMLFSTSLSAKYNEEEETYIFKNPLNGLIITALIIYSVIFGMRYNVGVDHLMYLKDYEELKLYKISDQRYELGYAFIASLFASLKLHYSILFTFLAFIQMYFLFLTFKNYRDVLPWVVVTFMLGCVFLTFMNTMRQQIAFCIFLYSIEFIRSKEIFKYFAFILLAALFHKTALMLLPLYFLFQYKESYFNNLKVQFILLIVSLFILYINIFEDLFNSMDAVINLVGYDKYIDLIDRDDSLLNSLDKERGMGFYIILIVDVILLANSTKVKLYFNNTIFPILYDLYFFGVIYGYITNGSILLSRPNEYILGVKFIVAAFSLLYYFRNKENNTLNKFLFYTLLGLYVLIFVGTMYRMNDNFAFFTFFWQIG